MAAIVRKRNTGEPGNPGQFGSKTHSEATVTLDGGFRPDDGFPRPQANNLDHVTAVVDAVSVRADTPRAIGEALGMTEREGAYYGDAAGYLNLVSVADRAPKTYQLTATGQELADLPPEHRAQMVRGLVAQLPEIRDRHDGDVETSAEELADQGLSETTAARRAATTESWYRAITSDQFDRDVSQVVAATTVRAVRAAQTAAQEREDRRVRQAEPVEQVCTGCFMILPTSGVCQNCE